MAEVVGAPLMSLSERELSFICNIHRVEIKKFKPLERRHDALLHELQINNEKTLNRVNIRSLHENIIANGISSSGIAYINEILKAECLDKSYFDWINTDNDRLCNFIWAYIQCAKEKIELVNDADFVFGHNMNTNSTRFEKTLYISPENIIKETSYISFGLQQDAFRFVELNPTNNKIIKRNVISFFDTWDVSLNEKEKNIKTLENKWTNIRNFDDLETWIPKNDPDKINWAWSYIHKDAAPDWFINDNHRLDKYLGIITTFDLLNEYQDKRSLLKKNMKSAWSQKAYRDKNNGKRAVSIVLSEDIIKKLDFVCENTDRRKNEVVTRLIREEYDKIKKGGH
ncbi:hypothetical protein GP476_17645 [Aeromonas dhakensis]|uniref:hypothetical protein n=1 Tax=Aeromonas dhakensis TaxID=196024 RepID=UPI0021B32B17|nr:hypothetical protein [Aeromonas dhakensis]UXB13175.1 hypothetical protein GP476_17645 [Aeromonas dhakensis]